MNEPRLNAAGFYYGNAWSVQELSHPDPSGPPGFAVMCLGRSIVGIFRSKEVANGIAATFDALTPEGASPDGPPMDALLNLVGFRLILADVVEHEAKRLASEELATRAAAARLRGRRWP